MTHKARNVKPHETLWSRMLCWMDAHPRLGWWLVIVAHANLLLNLLDVFGHLF
jgi:hypothetical protein